jgi:hypothetical protein
MPMQAEIWGGSSRPTYSQPATRPLYAREKVPVRTVREAGWASGSVWTSRKISPPPGVDPRTVQPVASDYTNYAPRFRQYEVSPIFLMGFTADITRTALFNVPTDDGYSAKRLQSVKLSSASSSIYAHLPSMLKKNLN